MALKQLNAGLGSVYYREGNGLYGEWPALNQLTHSVVAVSEGRRHLRFLVKSMWRGHKHGLSCNWYSRVCKKGGRGYTFSCVRLRRSGSPSPRHVWEENPGRKKKKTAFSKEKSRASVWLQGSQIQNGFLRGEKRLQRCPQESEEVVQCRRLFSAASKKFLLMQLFRRYFQCRLFCYPSLLYSCFGWQAAAGHFGGENTHKSWFNYLLT